MNSRPLLHGLSMAAILLLSGASQARMAAPSPGAVPVVTLSQLFAHPRKYENQTVMVKNFMVGWVDPKSRNMWEGRDHSLNHCRGFYSAQPAHQKVGDVETLIIHETSSETLVIKQIIKTGATKSFSC